MSFPTQFAGLWPVVRISWSTLFPRGTSEFSVRPGRRSSFAAGRIRSWTSNQSRADTSAGPPSLLSLNLEIYSLLFLFSCQRVSSSPPPAFRLSSINPLSLNDAGQAHLWDPREETPLAVVDGLGYPKRSREALTPRVRMAWNQDQSAVAFVRERELVFFTLNELSTPPPDQEQEQPDGGEPSGSSERISLKFNWSDGVVHRTEAPISACVWSPHGHVLYGKLPLVFIIIITIFSPSTDFPLQLLSLSTSATSGENPAVTVLHPPLQSLLKPAVLTSFPVGPDLVQGLQCFPSSAPGAGSSFSVAVLSGEGRFCVLSFTVRPSVGPSWSHASSNSLPLFSSSSRRSLSAASLRCFG